MAYEIAMDGARKSALGTGMMQSLLDHLRRAAGAPILLTGGGDAFSAGLDLREVAGFDAAGAEPFLRMLEECMSALYLYPGPTVAAVNGHAIAGGCVLALCCDQRIATSHPATKIGLNETPLGLRFPPRVLAIVRSRVPRQHLERVVLGGELFTPTEAQRVGLVDEVGENPVALARVRLDALSASPSAAYARTKRDLRGTVAQDLATDDVLDRWIRESLPVWTSTELKSKIAAALCR